jgi:hypothetical protein
MTGWEHGYLGATGGRCAAGIGEGGSRRVGGGGGLNPHRLGPVTLGQPLARN